MCEYAAFKKITECFYIFIVRNEQVSFYRDKIKQRNNIWQQALLCPFIQGNHLNTFKTSQ